MISFFFFFLSCIVDLKPAFWLRCPQRACDSTWWSVRPVIYLRVFFLLCTRSGLQVQPAPLPDQMPRSGAGRIHLCHIGCCWVFFFMQTYFFCVIVIVRVGGKQDVSTHIHSHSSGGKKAAAFSNQWSQRLSETNNDKVLCSPGRPSLK